MRSQALIEMGLVIGEFNLHELGSKTSLHYWMMVERDTQISREKLVVRLPAMKSPLYLIDTCQVVNCLPCFGVGLSAFRLKKVIS